MTEPFREPSISGADAYRDIHRSWEICHGLGSPIHAFRKSLVLRLVPPASSGAQCLDLGCGTGEYVGPLIDRGYRVDGVDISDYAIAQAQKNLSQEKREFFRGFVTPLEAFRPDSKFDLILCSEVLEHLEEPLPILKEMAHWVKHDGGLIISVPADPSLWSEEDSSVHHVRRYTEAQLKEQLAEAELAPETFWCYGYPSLRLLIQLKKQFLGKKGTDRVRVMGRKKSNQWILQWAGAMVRGCVYLTDRHFLRHPKGVGFVTFCRPLSRL
jgi:2-polyprenyl-3-methyl-5-hydroxy-6-metoxy-1,4-benzoquinol methylase